MKESFERPPTNLEENSGTILPNAPKNLESGDDSNLKYLSLWTL